MLIRKGIVLILSLIIFTGTTSVIYPASAKKTPATVKSGTVVKQLKISAAKKEQVVSKKKLLFDLLIEHISLDTKCQVIAELKNTGKDIIPESIFRQIRLKAEFGKFKINKKITEFDQRMILRYPGKKLIWKTGIIAKEVRNFSAEIDTHRVLKESNEINNKKNIKLTPRCKCSVKKIQKFTKSGNGFRKNTSGIPAPQIPGNLEPRSLESGIRILSPTEGQQFYSGSKLNVMFRLQNQSDALSLVTTRVTGAFLYLDGIQVADLSPSTGLPIIGTKNNQIGIDIPLSAPAADNYTVTIAAQRSSGETIFGISDRFSVEKRTASVSVLSRIMDRSRDEGITITSPRPAQQYFQGHNIPVRFSISTVFDHWSPETRPTAFRILLTSDESPPVNLYEGSETNLDLPIPEGTTSGDSYKIIVYGVEDSSWYGVAGNFSIGLSPVDTEMEGLPSPEIAPFLRITEPSDLISWEAGCTQRITLTTNVTLTSVHTNLLTVSSHGTSVIQSKTYSAGSPTMVGGQNQYTIFYQIPSDTGDNGRLGHYRLGIEQIGGEGLEAISGNIWLTQAGYQIIRPAGGDYWENLTIDWEITGCAAESYDIQLVSQTPGDPIVTPIITGLSASYASPSDIYTGRFAQTFHWSIPSSFARGSYKARLIVHERGVTAERIHESGEFFIIER